MIKKFLICFLVFLLISTSISAVGITIKKEKNIEQKNKYQENENIITINENSLKNLYSFFQNENPLIYYMILNSFNKAKLSNERQDIVELDTEILEKEFAKINLIFGIKIRFWRNIYINSEKGDYYNLRNPYDDPFFDNPFSIRWSFKSDSHSIQCYKNWKEQIGGIPLPVGNPCFNAKRIWFNSWGPFSHYDWEENKLGGVIQIVFAVGKKPSYNSLTNFYLEITKILINLKDY